MYGWLKTGSGLVIEFFAHLQIVTTSNSSATTNSHTQQFTRARTKSSQSALSSPVLSGSGFQRRTFPFLWVPELSPCLSYQRLTAKAHNDWTAVLYLTNSPINSSLPCTALTELSNSKLLYDCRFTANQFVSAPSPLRLTTRFLFFRTLAVIVLM
jgi:hypothetical protein